MTVSLLNCSASDTVRIDFTKPDCGCPVFIPNAFSPNNDLTNDELKLLNTFGVDLKVSEYTIVGVKRFSKRFIRSLEWEL